MKKRLLMVPALLLSSLVFADAGSSSSKVSPERTLNKSAFVGVNKTQSAQSLGHTRFAISFLNDATMGNDMFPKGVAELPSGKTAPVEDYIGLSSNVAMAMGIGDYFDMGFALPVYVDKFYAEDPALGSIGNTQIAYIGNLDLDMKIRMPLPSTQPMDLAVFLGGTVGTADYGKQGLWVREPEFIKKESYSAYAYGPKESMLKGGLAATMDLEKLNLFPFLLHLNGGYRYSLVEEFPSVFFGSAAMEVYPSPFISLFAEFYMDYLNHNYRRSGKEYNLDMKQLTGAVVIHTPAHVDIQLGGSYYLGEDKFIKMETMADEKRSVVTISRVNPEYTVFGGITWNMFFAAQDRDGDGVPDNQDKCPDDKGHKSNQGCPMGTPDMDGDGVCDAWVSEKGLLQEYSSVCQGVDKCPNEASDEPDGCPLDEPDMDGDGVCDPWVTKRDMLDRFADVCTGEDQCPAQAGLPAFNGCPTKLPDPDGDGLCSPWVAEEGATEQFAQFCHGVDQCPGEAGHESNKGCPWDDPDSDADGVCDPWVSEAGVLTQFEQAADDQAIAKEWFIEKTCKGVDQCPSEFGVANNDGCPLGNPDSDADGFCDPWVTEKNMLDQYDGICKGVDKCPTEPGDEAGEGCPLDNPDVDGDSLCAGWVVEKGLVEKFASVCHGVDQCPVENGPEWNKGCPAENPDPDGDSLCSPWVTKQSMLEQFAEVCHGYDRCEDEAGPEWNKGCPMEDDPDADKDGICSEWVSSKGLLKEFEGVCTGLDRCPDVAGDDGEGCPKKKLEKLDGVNFKSGKSSLESNAKKIVKSVAKKLKSDAAYKNISIVIQGHADNKEKKGKKLAEDRAKEVMKLLAKEGVNKKLMKAIGKNTSCPLESNKTSAGRDANRRVDFHFVVDGDDGTGCETAQ